MDEMLNANPILTVKRQCSVKQYSLSFTRVFKGISAKRTGGGLLKTQCWVPPLGNDQGWLSNGTRPEGEL